jgi:hypothetical protein
LLRKFETDISVDHLSKKQAARSGEHDEQGLVQGSLTLFHPQRRA